MSNDFREWLNIMFVILLSFYNMTSIFFPDIVNNFVVKLKYFMSVVGGDGVYGLLCGKKF